MVRTGQEVELSVKDGADASTDCASGDWYNVSAIALRIQTLLQKRRKPS